MRRNATALLAILATAPACVLARADSADASSDVSARVPLAGPADASTPASANTHDSERDLTLDAPVQLAGTMPLSRFVDLVSELTRTRYIYTPSELGEQVALRLPDEARLSELRTLLAQALHARGLTTVRAPGSDALLVVRLEQAGSLATLSDPGDASFVTVLLPARSRSPADLADAVRPLLSKQGAITVLSAGQGLLISERRDRLDQVLPVLARLDTPADSGLHRLPLEHLGPEDASDALRSVVDGLASAGRARPRGSVLPDPAGGGLLLLAPAEAVEAWRELVSRVDQRQPGEVRAYALRRYAPRDMMSLVEAAGLGAHVRVLPDDVTGGLLVTATPREHERLAELLARFDTAPDAIATMRVFPVRNRAVGEVLAVLRTLIGAGGLDAGPTSADQRRLVSDAASQTSLAPVGPLAAGSSPASDAPTSPGIDSPLPGAPRQPAGGLSLTADEDTNSLLAIGSSRELSQVASLLAVLDQRQPQVMLEAILVSITESDALSLGVELDAITGSGATRVRLSSLLGLASAPPLTTPPSPGGGFTGLVLSPGDYAVLVRALESVTRGRSISRPTVLVANNQQATFSSVLQQPITQQTRTGSNDTTFSFGGSDSAGTTISVRPQIAHADHLVLTYSIRLSSFVGQSGAVGLPPPKQENSVDSVATIPDGHTIVVGGLDLRTRSETDAGVPVLSRVPILGTLFGQDTRGEGRTRFFVFIRATVLRSGAFTDLRYLSAQDASDAGLSPDAPQVSPRVIR